MVKRYAIDIETKDPHLKAHGPGVRRRDGHVVGVAIGWMHDDGSVGSEYLPLRHPDTQNVPRDVLRAKLAEVLRSGVPITGANLLYDFDWLEAEFGLDFSVCPWHDVQVLEPLIDENAGSYSLGAISERWLGESKSEDAMYQWLAMQFGGKPDRSQAANIWRAPAWIVEEYARSDVELPLRIVEKQLEVAPPIWEVETALQPILLRMRQRGVRIDEARLDELSERFAGLASAALDRLGGISVWSAKQVAETFDRAGVRYPHTERGAPSFTKEFLSGCPADVARWVLEARQYDKLRGTFLELRGDEYGTVTGRLSSSLPNLQQVPARTEQGKLIRSLFVPEQGEQWYKLDYSQIEPRLLLSYARGREAEEAVAAYQADPTRDCYNTMMESMPSWITRDAVKAIFLGASYGMGKAKMAAQMGVPMEEAEHQFQAFHDGAPYIRSLSQKCTAHMERHGQIKTIGGRVRRIPERELAYKALNSLIQGGAADIMKRALVEGVSQGLPVPLLTVHDELDFSSCDGDAMRRWAGVMCEVYSDLLKVRMHVDVEKGPSWGQVAGL